VQHILAVVTRSRSCRLQLTLRPRRRARQQVPEHRRRPLSVARWSDPQRPQPPLLPSWFDRCVSQHFKFLHLDGTLQALLSGLCLSEVKALGTLVNYCQWLLLQFALRPSWQRHLPTADHKWVLHALFRESRHGPELRQRIQLWSESAESTASPVSTSRWFYLSSSAMNYIITRILLCCIRFSVWITFPLNLLIQCILWLCKCCVCVCDCVLCRHKTMSASSLYWRRSCSTVCCFDFCGTIRYDTIQ